MAQSSESLLDRLLFVTGRSWALSLGASVASEEREEPRERSNEERGMLGPTSEGRRLGSRSTWNPTAMSADLPASARPNLRILTLNCW